MTSSPPTRFENYRAERVPPIDHRPVPVPTYASPPVSSVNGMSRRTVLPMITVAAGAYRTSVPEGWEVRESRDSRLPIENGASSVGAYPYRWPSPSIGAAEELPARVRPAVGTYQGRAATVWADLWVRDRAALMAVRVVTAGPGSAEAVAAEQMSDELSEGFR